ncbi:MAG TPA: hypothetical protein VGZ22_30035 [Isosphaeraceae bacterium]|jgi:hypothetical protein|nr:hypothetical protein [Isosphaeraceae bacterium]
MATTQAIGTEKDDQHWFIVSRWHEYAGEERTNLLRIVGIGAFYLVELVNYYGLNLGFIEMPRLRNRPFHLAVTAVAVAWVMVALGVHLCLRRRVFPAALKFLTTGCDLLLLTALLCVADGPRSPAVAVYFLILALATLRLSPALVRFATLGAMASYLVVLGYAKWFTSRSIRVPRYHELMFLIALGLTGFTLGQAVRLVRKVAQDYAARLSREARRV